MPENAAKQKVQKWNFGRGACPWTTLEGCCLFYLSGLAMVLLCLFFLPLCSIIFLCLCFGFSSLPSMFYFSSSSLPPFSGCLHGVYFFHKNLATSCTRHDDLTWRWRLLVESQNGGLWSSRFPLPVDCPLFSIKHSLTRFAEHHAWSAWTVIQQLSLPANADWVT